MVVEDQEKPDIDKIYLCAKDPFKLKCQLLINGREKVGIEKLKNPKAFIAYSKTWCLWKFRRL